MTIKDRKEIEKIFFYDFKPATARLLKAAFRFDRQLRKAFERVLKSSFAAAYGEDADAKNYAVDARHAAVDEFARLPITGEQAEAIVNEIVRAVYVYVDRLREERNDPVLEKTVDDLARLVASVRKLPDGYVRERAESFVSSFIERFATIGGVNASVIRQAVNADWHTYRTIE